MAKYLDKWKDLFPDTVGGTTRPSEAVSDQEEFNTDGFPQFIAQDPVNYALQNAFLKQFLSNDAWLWVKQKQANQALDDHKVDTQAHAKGISGNAGSATKLANARTINLSGAVTADAVSFDGTADATINVKTLDASKLKGTASVSTTGNAGSATKVVTTAASGASANIAEATMASNDLARIRVSGETNAGELALETADDGSEPIVARQYTGIYETPVRTAKILDESGNTSFPGTVVAPKFTGTLNGNASTATKLQTPRTLSLTGKAAGSATFDGSSNAIINVTSVNADTAAADSNGVNIAANYVKKSVGLTTENLNDIHTPGLYFCNMDVDATTARNYPTGRASAVIVTKDGANGDDSCTQLCMPYVGNGIYKRQYDPVASKWSTWRSVAFTDSNVASASKLAAARTISLTGNASGSAAFDGSADANISVTVNESKHAAAADNSNKLGGYPLRPTATGGNYGTVPLVNTDGVMEVGKYIDWHATNGGTEDYSSRWEAKNDGTVLVGTINGTLNGNADSATNADKVDGVHAASLFYHKGDWNANNWATIGTYQVNGTPPVSGAYGWGQVISSSTTDGRFQLYASHRYAGTGRLQYRTGYGDDKQPWNTILDSENYNLFAPTKTGGGASGTWGINISGNADTVDGYHEDSFLRYRGNAAATGKDTLWNQIGIKEYDGILPEGVSSPYNFGAVVSLPGEFARLDIWYTHQCSDNGVGLWFRSGWGSDKKAWARLLDSNNYTNWAPTKTGGGASGTWGINITGNAASATNADKLDGYHASDLLRTLGGNRTPVITDIFDRAGTIDMSTMSAADKATHKANINKAENVAQNLRNDACGIYAYGGDIDINGYYRGTLKLTQSWKNFDKLMIVYTDDKAGWELVRMFDVYEFNYCMERLHSFNLLDADTFWYVYGLTKHGTDADFKPSTETILSCRSQNCGIIGIYGIKY